MAKKVVFDSLKVELAKVVAVPPEVSEDGKSTYPVLPEGTLNAYELLEHNTSNRLASNSLINRYSATMLTNQWAFDLPIMIVFDKFGNLHNGQHTLNALIVAERARTSSPESTKEYKSLGIKGPITLTAVLVTGIRPETADFLDMGKSRTHKDVTYRHQFFADQVFQATTKAGHVVDKNLSSTQHNQLSGYLATAAKILWLRLTYAESPRSSRKFSHADMLDTYKTYGGDKESFGLTDAATFIWQTNLTSQNGLSKLLPLPYFIAAYYLAVYSERTDTDSVNYFFEALADSSILNEKGAAAHELREWLISKIGNGGNELLNQKFNAVILGLDYYFNEQPVENRKVFNCKVDDYPILGGLDVLPETPEELAAEAESASSADPDESGEDADLEAGMSDTDSTTTLQATAKAPAPTKRRGRKPKSAAAE